VPRRINNLCDRTLLYAFLEDIELINADVVDTVAHELGGELWGGNRQRSAQSRDRLEEVFNTPGQPLETMARVMFDKANVQQRIGSLERAVDWLGSSLKSDVTEIRNELANMRALLEDMLHQLRSDADLSDSDVADPEDEVTVPYRR